MKMMRISASLWWFATMMMTIRKSMEMIKWTMRRTLICCFSEGKRFSMSSRS